nr:endoglucanase 10 [Tanacetum cinerariifolium]
GKLVNNTIPRRDDSALIDREEANIDLSKGMYDAGDHMMFGFPIAFTATILPEDMTEKRPLTKVTTSKTGSDVVAVTAAAMTSASLVFKSSNSQYSSLLLKHAEELFNFAKGNRGCSKSFPQVEAYYKSSDYGDELLWGA